MRSGVANDLPATPADALPRGLRDGNVARDGNSTTERDAIRARSAWILLVSVLLFAAMAMPFFRGMIYAADDLWAFHLPVRAFYADCLDRGVPFDWMPQLYSGFYLTGEGQGGVYHPIHWLLYRWLPLRTAFDLELLLPYPLMFAGMFFWLRRRISRPDAVLFGAMCFTFGSFNLLHFIHPNAISIIAHLPWLLLCVDVGLTSHQRRTRVGADAGLATLIASQLLLGYPQYVWFSLLAMGAYALWLVRSRPRNANINYVPASARLAAMLGLGVAIGAIQLLPTMDALAHSTRQAADTAFANTGAWHPANLVQLVAPYAFQTRVFGDNTHEQGLYLGAAPLLLIVLLAAGRNRVPRRIRNVAVAAAVFAGLALLLCLGQAGGLYALQMKLPLVGRFRLPARYLLLVNLAASVLAAVGFLALTRAQSGFNSCRQREGQKAAIAGQGWMLVAASVLVSMLIWIIWRGDRAATLPLVVLGPAILTVGVLLVRGARTGIRFAMPALVLFTAIDLGAYGLSYAVWPASVTVDEAELAIASVVPQSETSGRVIVDGHTAGQPRIRAGNHAVLAGAHLADGYAGLEPANAAPFASVESLRLAGVTLVTNRGGNAEIDGLNATEDGNWLTVPNPLPRAWLVSRTIVAEQSDISELLPTIDPARFAIVERPLELHKHPSSAAQSDKSEQPEQLSSITRELDQPGRIRLSVRSHRPQLLIVNERFHPGWQATVDGRSVDVVRTYGQYLGCVVDRNSGVVEFTFAPSSLRAGKWITAVGLLLLTLVTLVRFRRAE